MGKIKTLVGLCLLLGLAWPGSAQDAPIDAPLVDATHAKTAHQLIEAWVRAGSVPEQVDRKLEVTGVIGVSLTLRDMGRSVGRGETYRLDIEDVIDRAGPPIDLVPLLKDATRQALADYAESVKNARLNAINQGRADPASPKPQLKTDLLTVGLEVGHKLESIHVPRIAPPGDINVRFAPGYHGLRVEGQKPGESAVTWPATALARNTQPKSQIVQPLSQLGYPIDAISRVGRQGGAPIQRFETIHIIRPNPNAPAIQLIRGNAPKPRHGKFLNQLNLMTDQLASHLGQRVVNQNVRGTYLPTTNTFDPMLANQTESALAAYALARYAEVSARLGRGDVQTDKLADHAGDVAAGTAQLAKEQGASPIIAALSLLAFCELPIGGEQQRLRDELGLWLLMHQTPSGLFERKMEDEAKPVNLPANAAIAAGLASLHAQTRDPRIGEAAIKAIHAVWEQSNKKPDISALPWLMLAHDKINMPEHAKALAQQARKLGDLVDKLNEQQVIEPPLLGPNDVAGGYELTHGPPGSPPTPDWRSSQPLLFLSLALRHPEARNRRNVWDWLISAQNATRFLNRLMLDRNSAYYTLSVEDSINAVRLSLWDNHLPVTPTALSLLALTELQASTRVLEDEQAGRPPQAVEVPVDVP